MSQSIVVDLSPVAMYEGADEKKKRALRLMEIRHQSLDNLILVAWSDDNLRATVQG